MFDTGGDTDAQSQYSLPLAPDKVKMMTFLYCSTSWLFYAQYLWYWRWHWRSISILLALLAPEKVKMTTFLYCSTCCLFDAQYLWYWRWHWRSISILLALLASDKVIVTHFFTVPQVDYFMPDISDTGGDTGAQSQYSWLWLHSNSFLCSQLFSDFWSVLFSLSTFFDM